MEKYNVTGMSCAACQARVEKAVSAVPGVENCAVSLLTNSMGVEGSADSSEIIKAIENAGYGASLASDGGADGETKQPNYDDALADTESPKIRKRLIASLILLVPLMYVSMGHMMWNWPLPTFLDGNHVAMGIYELVLAGLVMVINQKFFISGFKGVIHGAPNMDTLVAMGSAASFVYSLYALFAMTGAQLNGDEARVMALMDDFYFESAAMILTLITVGKLLESISKGRTTDALKDLMKLAAKTAVILKDGAEVEVPIEQVKIGDRFVVKPGDNIPVDGVVIDGSSAVNESALTGESIPVDKQIGDTVSAATSNESGYLVCEATRVGKDTTLSQIIQMVSDAAATKAPIAKIADRVSGIFVPTVIGIALITFLIWLFVDQPFGFALSRAISVLVISCPCALGLATPVAIMVGNGMGAKHGIMFKTAVSLEETGKVQIVALDKTGTITKGEPKVIGIFEAEGTDDVDLLRTAFALENKSEHPLAKAIVAYGLGEGLEPAEVSDFKVLSGNGLTGILDGKQVYGGNLEFISSKVLIEDIYLGLADTLSEKGETPLFFASDERFLGIISVADVIKEDSPEAIKQLKNMGIHVVMLTGDNPKTAAAIAAEAGVDEVVAGVKPDGKEEVIRKLQEFGKVAMVGDGINDAPALTRADMGIAIGAGTDVAIDAADVVLMKSRLTDVAAAVRLSRATLTNIHENLFWAFFYNVIGIPLAAGAYIHAFGWTLNPMFGAAAMSLSSFCVVTNALRLNLFKMTNHEKDKPLKNSLGHEPLLESKTIVSKEEDNTMEITVKGMMCQHCEAHVKEALEKLAGVEEATANHDENLVTLKTSGEVAEADIKAAVEGAGYEFVRINS
ncbi:heavy metal translocating P-type ATPase [Pseudobutyrivibrio xylanivorans]|uniref:Copper-exporting P-type ATPase n=1 Tax=Pseudobutyrivibrio xylanivorans TaxID=185007 RepID=A0A5P6VRW5_PSEXY|nr:heavy metal translocating P-type ATPase [Pseudobutyrivibrio xylanivorans]QFJ54439.1 heavy metal translocating P-type ATPase [Pseudobutyrivibrio xylanivorans]